MNGNILSKIYQEIVSQSTSENTQKLFYHLQRKRKIRKGIEIKPNQRIPTRKIQKLKN